ncbi:MAG: hypothetical protein ACRDZN_06970, partial [Acidimicrobiales bacterium]
RAEPRRRAHAHTSLVRDARRAEIVVQVSLSQVWRILTAMHIDLTKVRGWLNRRDDPTFWGPARDGAACTCTPRNGPWPSPVDEKTSIQAKQRW